MPDSDPSLSGNFVALPHDGEVPAPLRVGRSGPDGSVLSSDVVLDGNRYFGWIPTLEDERFAPFAGWDEFPRTDNPEFSQLEIPSDTRSAASVLAGTEAWPGEKDQVIEYLVGYVQNVHNHLGVVDTGLQLDGIGITRGNEQMFVLPPHDGRTDTESAGKWLQAIRADLHSVLLADPRREELLEQFDTGMVGKADGP